MRRIKRLASSLLAFCMLLSMVPIATMTAVAADGSADVVKISDKNYALAPGITEHEYITNNSALTKQQVGHYIEMAPGASGEIRVGYNDYNISAIQSGENWAMVEPTKQAENAETVDGIDVVGVVNGDFFNMANGCPSGYTVMQGVLIRDVDSTCFWIDSKGNAHISANRAEVEAVCEAEGVTVWEALGGGVILLKDGERTASGSAYGDAPNPRTVVGMKADGTVIIYMVNGRQAPYSAGMTYGDLADIMLSLGCENAINLDGGGSSAFATQREGEPDNATAGLTMRARPSDGYERKVSTCLMVVSTAESDNVFDHASITPSQEIYTPGSEVPFLATGVDKAGKPAELPTEGVEWTILSGGDLGVIDPVTGVFTGNEGQTGTVTVAYLYNGEEAGSATIELQWPDKLGFTNTSVSLDFGKHSDLSFYPTYQGREVHYKDGDFTWSLEAETYKYNVLIETKDANPNTGFAGNGQKDMTMALNGRLNVPQKLQYSAYGTWWNYSTEYMETAKAVETGADGAVTVSSTVKNTHAWTYKYVYDDDGKTIIGQNEIPVDSSKLQADQVITFPVGQFVDNGFTADENNSLRGTITVSRGDLTGSIEVIVGMEPYVLMDFEDGTGTGGSTIPAEEYWGMHVGSSSNTANGNGQLTIDEMKESRVWIRDTTNRGVKWPKNADGTEMNGIVSADEDSNVRFGQYAMRLAWDFTQVDTTTVAAADFGPSAIVYVHAVQPTKLGFWLNVPRDLADDDSILKCILVGNGSPVESSALAYWDLRDDGTMTFHEGQNISGTTTYFQYYSYDAEGNVSGSKLSDWAGKGWTWVEADISSLQFPIGVQRGYTVRVTSPQNCTKGSGHIYIDNLQLIYGTNTNDVNNPVIDSVTEKSTGTTMQAGQSVEMSDGQLSFEVAYSDSELTDKYASGIDVNGVRVYVDGVDYTDEAEISAKTLLLSGLDLKNGTHTLRVQVKDTFGNVTTNSYDFTVQDPEGADPVVRVVPNSDTPMVGQEFSLSILGSADVKTADVTIDLPSDYAANYEVVPGAGYTAEATMANNQVTIHIEKAEDPDAVYSDENTLATLVLKVPEDAAEGANLRYTVSMGTYTTAGGETATFSAPEAALELAADYQLSSSQSVVGMDTVFTLTDSEGNPVAGADIYCDGARIGATDSNGQFSHIFNETGRKTVYAAGEGHRSWNIGVVVCGLATDGDGSPFGIQLNATANADTAAKITWMSAIGSSQESGWIRYSTDSAAVESAEAVQADSEILAFAETTAGNAMRLHTATLQNLTPGATYYYQVGDGEKWSEVLSFTTAQADKKGDTSFLVLGDMQTDNTARLAAALNTIEASGIDYSFALQTGDAIDNVTAFSQWRALFNVLNAGTLPVPMVHALGNHEYYGAPNGEISRDIFALLESGQGSYYAVEYGSVYIGVINNGGDIEAALEEMKADAAASQCEWKVLVLHEPVYGSMEEMPDAERKAVTDAVEAAGIEFVFTGDHHAYARTYPMAGDVCQDENSVNGAVYFISGDLSSKDNAFEERDYFAYAVPHNDYNGCYLSVTATATTFTVTAYDSEGNLLDTYTRTRTDCQQGNHKADSDSLYNVADQTISCSVCGEFVDSAKVGYSGLLSTTDGKLVILAEGTPKKDMFQVMGTAVYHIDGNGYAHEAQVLDPANHCVQGGYQVYECTACNVRQEVGDLIMPVGHTWDENHVCTVCETVGKNIADAEQIDFGTFDNPRGKPDTPYYYIQNGGVRPSFFVSYDGEKPLTWSNDANLNEDRTMRDLYVSWTNDRGTGVATVNITGRGDYYGTATLTYIILPQQPSNLRASSVETDSVTLEWNAALGAEYYEIYRCTNAAGGGAVKIAETADTSYTVIGLEAETDYYYTIRSCASGYATSRISAIAVKTEANPPVAQIITGIEATVGGQVLPVYDSDTGLYLFLPAGADLTNLSLRFTVSGSADAVILSGAGSDNTYRAESQNGYQVDADITALATKGANGVYRIEVTVDGYKAMSVNIMQASEISTIYLKSDNPEEDREWVDASKSNETTGSMVMTDADGVVIYDGGLKEIKARGNSTFTYSPKKSYQIKLKEDSDLLGTGEDVKTWVLLAGYGDATQMHDKFFKDLAEQMGMDYVTSCNWVNLYYDGEYRGVYLLSEKVSVGGSSVDIEDLEKAYEDKNPNYGEDMQTSVGTNKYGQKIQFTTGLVDPDSITGGYLIELNHDFIDEASGFWTKKGVAFNVKGPEWCSEDAMKYISEYYQEFEDAVYAADGSGYNAETGLFYYDYVDVDSLVKIFLIQELGLNADGFISSLFFYKDADGKMYAGPVWDQEMTLGTGWTKYNDPGITDYHYLAEALIRIPDFRAKVSQYYTEVFKPMIESALAEGGSIDEYYAMLKDNAQMNYVLWDYIRVGSPDSPDHIWENVVYEDVVADMKAWITERLPVLDKNLILPSGGLLGDANDNGVVDNWDALLILKYVVGDVGEDALNLDLCDVNENGRVDNWDAQLVLEYFVGNIDSFPA